MKTKLIAAMAATLAMGCATAASAGVYTDDMTRCLVKATSDADRDTLIRWMFAAMANNGSVKSFSTITADQHKQMERAGGLLFQRLLPTECRKETVAALKFEGNSALESRFGALGQVAMRGLMADPAVSNSMVNWVTFVDQDALKAMLKEAGVPVAPDK